MRFEALNDMALTEDPKRRDAFYEFIPWNTDDLWREVNQCMAYTVKIHRRSLHRAVETARSLYSDLKSTYSVMDELCADICPECREPCCRVAKLWFDFRDLIFLHLNKIPIPDAQPLAHYNDSCRYLGAAGCLLPRQARPWICTYYVCPAQTARLRKLSRTRLHELNALLENIKTSRKRLEDEYVQGILPSAPSQSSEWRKIVLPALEKDSRLF
ncbi:MAG: hypothetical protein R6U50_10110 [Desulfobacterales bacterium]